MKIDIIDDFLSEYHADHYVKIFDGTKVGTGIFPWFFCNNLNDNGSAGHYYFNHSLIMNYEVESYEWLPIFEPLVNRIGISFDNVWRLKVNLYPWTQRRFHHHSHTDYPSVYGLKTALYYVNDCNRDTVFDGKKKIRSKKNRVILFDGSNYHHSTTPLDSNYGCSINVDYKL